MSDKIQTSDNPKADGNELVPSCCSTIYRCGHCGHPTDPDGHCLIVNPEAYLKDHIGATEVPTNGECCDNKSQSYIEEQVSWSREMDGEGVHW